MIDLPARYAGEPADSPHQREDKMTVTASTATSSGNLAGASAPVQPLPPQPQESLAEYANRLALLQGIILGLITGLLIFLLNANRQLVPLAGDMLAISNLVGFCLVFGTLITAAVSYALGTIEHNRRAPTTHDRRWLWAIVPVAFTYALAALALATLGLKLIDAAFHELSLGRIEASLLGAGLAGAMVYSLAQQATQLNSVRLLRTAIVVIAAGVYLSATQISDPTWWRVSFSYLGSWDSTAHQIFNVTLIFGGVLLLVWTPFFMKDLHTLARNGYAHPRGVYWFQFGLYWVAVALLFVGLFKTRDGTFSSIMHNLSAYSLAGMLGAMMVGVRFAVPRIGREFQLFTLLLVAAMAVVMLFAAIGRFNTVGLEILSFTLGIYWLHSFVVSSYTTARRLEPAAYPD